VPKPSERSSYSIAAVSKLTGVSCHALRAWERRYGFPVPDRSPSGHRRYDAEQVEAIRRLVGRLREGAVIGEAVSGFLAAHPAAPGGVATPRAAVGEAGELVERLIAADLAGAESSYARLCAGRPPAARATEVIEPVLVEVGERWFRGECSVCQEHCATQFLRGKLHALTDEARRANLRPARRAVIGTVQGERHEGGVLILGLLLELAGWRTLSLGVDLPVRDFQEALARWRPDALGVSFVLSRNINKRFEELGRLRDVPVFVGGRSVLNYQGLARRHGLIPLAGPASSALPPFLAEAERRRARPSGV
jgi:methanogenic corrinoid protein MtbC1